jgi:hypothetical protein
MKTIGIFDKGSGRFTDQAIAAAKIVWNPSDVAEINGSSTGIPTGFNEHEIVVAHITSDQWNLLIENWPQSLQVFIRTSSVGSGGMGESYDAPKRLVNGPWLFHIQRSSPSISEHEWFTLFDAIKSWEMKDSLPSQLESILGSWADAKLALRLLLDAKAFCGNNDSKAFSESGLTIHAPMTLDHWLEPFKSSSSSGIKELAELIVSEDTSEAAQRVKDAVSSNRDLETEIRNYLKLS